MIEQYNLYCNAAKESANHANKRAITMHVRDTCRANARVSDISAQITRFCALRALNTLFFDPIWDPHPKKNPKNFFDPNFFLAY